MLQRTLLKKDWKQAGLVWILLVVLGLLCFTVPVWGQMQSLDEEYATMRSNPSAYEESYGKSDLANMTRQEFFTEGSSTQLEILYSLLPFGLVMVFYFVFTLIIATVLLGNERNSHMSDFTMALPYKRTQIYMSKWFIGISGLFVTSVLGTAATMMMIQLSNFDFLLAGYEWSTMLYGVYAFLIGASFFTLALWMGAVGGEAISQAIWGIIALIFPIGFLFLVQSSIYTLAEGVTAFQDNVTKMIEHPIFQMVSPLINTMNFDSYMFLAQEPKWISIFLTSAGYAVASIVIFLVLGLFCFNKAPQENNGRFFLFTNWVFIVHIMLIICMGMLGGIIFSSMGFDPNARLYVFGFIVGGFLAHLLAKGLLYRFNLQLKS